MLSWGPRDFKLLNRPVPHYYYHLPCIPDFLAFLLSFAPMFLPSLLSLWHLQPQSKKEWNSNKWNSSSADSLLAICQNTGEVWNKNSSTRTLLSCMYCIYVAICVLLHVCLDTLLCALSHVYGYGYAWNPVCVILLYISLTALFLRTLETICLQEQNIDCTTV